VEKIGPERLELFGQYNRTTNCLERLHQRLKATLSKHPNPLMFVRRLISEVFKKDEANANVQNVTVFPKAKVQATDKWR
jgi:hypothetical protein